MPTSFPSSEAYQDAFLPLLREETRENLRSELERVAVSGSSRVEFVPHSLRPETTPKLHGKPHSEPRRGDCLTRVWLKLADPSSKSDAKSLRRWTDTTAVLLSKHPDAIPTTGDLSGGRDHILGIVVSSARPPFVEVLVLEEQWRARALDRKLEDTPASAEPSAKRRRKTKSAPSTPPPTDDAKEEVDVWYGWAVSPLVSALRELVALRTTPALYTPLRDALLSGTEEDKGDASLQRPVRLSPAFLDFLRDRFNESQAAAILTAARGEAFTLIQGPPGTGKTTTLLTLLNTIHVSAVAHYHETLLQGREQAESELVAPEPVVTDGQGEEPQAEDESLSLFAPRSPDNDPDDDDGNDDKEPAPLEPSAFSGSASSRRRLTNMLRDLPGSSDPGRLPHRLVSGRGLADWFLRTDAPPREYLDYVRRALDLRPRILVAAPSNAAIDAVVERLTQPHAMLDGTLRPYRPPIVRLGSGVGHRVKAAGIALEQSVDDLLALDGAVVTERLNGLRREMAQMEADLHRFKRQFNRRMGEQEPPETITADIAAPLIRCLEEYHRLRRKEEVYAFRAQGGGAAGGDGTPGVSRKDLRHHLRMALLDGAEIVLATLSATGLNVLEAFVDERGRTFSHVVIDEAAQAIEASTLIPLKYGCKHCVLVGDPQQLPATVLSPRAVRAGLDRSLFARLVEGGHSVHLLDTQYRSHPHIAQFPSDHFYDGKVKNAMSVCGPHRVILVHRTPHFRPMLFFDVQEGAEESTRSATNLAEARFAVGLLRALMEWQDEGASGPERFSGSAFLLTPYQGQLAQLERSFTDEMRRANSERIDGRSPPYPLFPVDMSTVDGAQGQERDVVVLSTVRAQPPPSDKPSDARAPADERMVRKRTIGFLKDVRRMNVALTRARYCMWVVGHASTLATNPDWKAFLDAAHRAGSVITVPSVATFLRSIRGGKE